MTSMNLFTQLYIDNDDGDSGDDVPDVHQLDIQPQSFLHLSNSEFEGMFNITNPCRYMSTTEGVKRKILIPEISRRCFMRWPVGAQLASGTGAVVYDVDCDDDPTNQHCAKVARISQLRTKQDTSKFTRDVQARYLLSCKNDKIQITGLIDAFICTTKTKRFGVTISGKYDGSLIKHVLSLSSSKERREFIKYAHERLVWTVSEMHACKIVHRDLHHGNILVHHPPGGDLIIALTDFESALGDHFETSDRVFSAYVHSDNSAILAIIAELETVCQFMDKEINMIDTHLLDALGIVIDDGRIVSI
jgi:serine/threonine protein kinase